MDDAKILNRRYETVAWGAFFILLGIVGLSNLPEGSGAIGIGVIFLALNAVRYTRRIPTSGFTVTLGIIAIVLGGVQILRDTLHLPFEIDIFPILLIVIGVIMLTRAMIHTKT